MCLQGLYHVCKVFEDTLVVRDGICSNLLFPRRQSRFIYSFRYSLYSREHNFYRGRPLFSGFYLFIYFSKVSLDYILRLITVQMKDDLSR